MKLVLALDSGAHSIFNAKLAGRAGDGDKVKGIFARETATYDFYESQEFMDYVDKYVDFVKATKSEFEFYVTIDAIFNPKKTEEVQTYLEKKGIKPLPVFHYGEDMKYLKKMMDRYDYIGIGGLGQDITKQKFVRFGDEVFKNICDKKGRPFVRTHGFAMTAFDLLTRYPWYSVDSTTPFVFARTGSVVLPKLLHKGGKLVGYDYASNPFPLAVTRRRSFHAKYYKSLPPAVQHGLQAYIESIGFTMDEVCGGEDDPVKTRIGYAARDVVNNHFMERFQEAVREQKNPDFRYYASGKCSAGTTGEFLTNLEKYGVKEFNYLGTFWLPKPTEEFIKHRKDRTHGNKAAPSRPKVGRAVTPQH